ncbi:hypothetical protein ACFOLJ_18200 [Rugamonas sp. CCM 8940]|uniref:hypothetical protein n=1 Tax=Rugamonas sp. CCM 8940 TaxID=2765359 RepID=UPI0018F41FEA|nr:hypothetical protein [Rugamonas sp. CCM 8940]MBJ7313519.1 hypothetical protein [Rugamonas sp. CCM 8940]
MKMPLVFDEKGDVSIHWSLYDAEQYFEVIDIKNCEYVGYDATGRLLLLKARNFFEVEISLAEKAPLHTKELIIALRRFIDARKKIAGIDNLSIVELFRLIEVNNLRN